LCQKSNVVEEDGLSEDSTLPRALGDGLVLRIVESDADAEKVIAINAETHGAEVGDILSHWFFEGHPTMSRGDWLFVDDERSDQAVATLSLMPTTWRYGGQLLPVAELGFVATRPGYRRRGLQRALAEAFDQMALSRHYSLAAIEGIPGFYVQFGYEYALPLVGGVNLEFEQVSDGPEQAGERQIMRRATPADVPALQALYDASIAELDVAAPRDVELWTYQLAVPEEIIFYGTTTVLEEHGRVVGYVRWNDDEWSDRLRVLELAVEAGPSAREWILAALRFARDKGRSSGKSGLRLQLPPGHPVVTVARYLGADDRGYYGWQMKVLDPVAFMWEIKPALETRLSGSLLAGYSGALVFNLYRSCLVLRFEEGRLVKASTLNDAAVEVRADAGMQLKQATQLWLGWRGREALETWYPDFWTREGARHLLDVLFPEARAYVYTPY
jgi:predicted N-acetyltransferase YhbS